MTVDTLAASGNPQLTGDVTLSAGSNISLTQVGQDIEIAAICVDPDAYSTAVLASTPRAYWKMQDASGNPVDSSGNGLNMTSVTGTPDYSQAGAMGDDSIRLVGGEALNRSSHISTVVNNFSMEMFFWPQACTAVNQTLFYNGNAGANGWGIIMDDDGRFQYLCGGVAVGAVSNGRILSDDIGFFHLAVVRDAGTWKYYINGTIDNASAGADAPGAPSGTVVVGGSASFQFAVAHLAVYETALSAATILAHFQASGRQFP